MQHKKVTIKCSQCGGAREGEGRFGLADLFSCHVLENESMLEDFNSNALNM